ncbi:unnamed protein product [Didymodactylos carnosus]|uniref:Uncharacterized protein n=1 Tax=Didymodactylos carnosus TaxID=1234261 RepID=A0A813TE84_9BILA|nr:unnamed protein product [Didymodactylos carnosus]CAF0807830.1 unnamed protein product [Didymodactylos carnosus]CAF3549976.1 unnamed protein product [Didymodactylos carnosus]CAF3593355.1 unnamed protein product [Didymodactylos carnosus]
MRDKVAQVRQQIGNEFTREQIELAILFYDSKVEDTIEAFKKNGAEDALSGWTEMNNRSSTSLRRGGGRARNNNNNTPRSNNNNNNNNNNRLLPPPPISSSSSSSQISHATNAPLRPSQRVLNIFNGFANKTQLVPSSTNDYSSIISTTTPSTLSLSLSSLADKNIYVNETPSICTDNNNTYDQQQSYISSSTDVSFHPYSSRESHSYDETTTVDDLQSSVHNNNIEFYDACDDYSSNDQQQTAEDQNDTIVDNNNNVNNNIDIDRTQVTRNLHNNNKPQPQRRRPSFRNTRNRTGSSSSTNLTQEQQQQPPDQTLATPAVTSTTTTSSSTQQHQDANGTIGKTTSKTALMNNKKVLGKSIKDLQRQKSTLVNVQSTFDNEIKQSLKKIDEIFKELTAIIKEREVQLYLEMDEVKKQGLNLINRRQQRAIELRGRIDRCDHLDMYGIDDLRNDIKQFVTDKRYDLADELRTSHRFEYDENIITVLSNFGRVLRFDRKEKDRTRTVSSQDSSALSNIPTNDITLNNNNTSQTTETTTVVQTPTLMNDEKISMGTIDDAEVINNEQNNERTLSTSLLNDIQSQPIQQKSNINGRSQIKDRGTAISVTHPRINREDKQHQPQQVPGDQPVYDDDYLALTRSQQPPVPSKNHPYGNSHGNGPPNGYWQATTGSPRNGSGVMNRQQQQQQWTNGGMDDYYYSQTNGYNNGTYEEPNGYYENSYSGDMNYSQQMNTRRRRPRRVNAYQGNQQPPPPPSPSQTNGTVNYSARNTPNGYRSGNGNGPMTQSNNNNKSDTSNNTSPSNLPNKILNNVNNNRRVNNNAKQVNGGGNGYANDQSQQHNGNNSNSEINGSSNHMSNGYSNRRQPQPQHDILEARQPRPNNQTLTNVSSQQ